MKSGLLNCGGSKNISVNVFFSAAMNDFMHLDFASTFKTLKALPSPRYILVCLRNLYEPVFG